MATTVRVQGADTLARTLGQLAARADDPRGGFDAVAGTIARAARSGAPKRTGLLAASVVSQAAPRMARVVATARYAPPVVSGVPRRRMRGNPFMTRAMEQTEPVWAGLFDRALQGECDKVRGV